MTVYWVAGAGDPTGGLTVQAGANDVRIISVELANLSGAGEVGWFYIGTPGASSMSGGTTQVPFPAKIGSPAALATARVGGADLTGTYRMCGGWAVTASVSGLGTTNLQANNAVGQWAPLGDLVLPPTGIFEVYGSIDHAVIWFEEMRLSWSY